MSTTEIPDIAGKYYDWKNIDKMIEQGKNFSNILQKIDDKIDELMNNGSILNLVTTIHKLNTKVKPVEFQTNRKEITNRYMNIFSTTLNPKHKSAWTKISYKERKNASMEIILQLNNLVKDNFCALNKNESFDLNLNNQTKFKNQLKTPNILLEAYNLKDDSNLNNKFTFPNNLNLNLIDYFGKNLIFFPFGLNLNETNLTNSEIDCFGFDNDDIENNFATGVVYKNLAEYLHYDKSIDYESTLKVNESAVHVISSISSMDDEFEFREEIDDLNSTDYSVRNSFTFKVDS